MSTKLRAAGVVASVYGYFLIFAQFAFVELMRGRGIGVEQEKLALGVMAVAGVAAGFLRAWRGVKVARLRTAMVSCAVAGAVAPMIQDLAGFLMVTLVTGAGIGIATVSVATLLPRWGGVAWVGLGTGLGYALCNLPWVFSAEPGMQAWVGAGFALLGAGLVPGVVEPSRFHHGLPRAGAATVAAVFAFLALVWLDSAAFFIIQHDRDLKEGTWGAAMLWRNAGLHLAAALVAGWWLRWGGWKSLLATAWAILAVAALAVNGESSRGLAGWWYPVGVSLYSTALVAWPGFLSAAEDEKKVAWRAAWVFGVAGWFGSANGIGMAETLQRVPQEFVAIAGVVIAVAVLGFRKWPALAGVGVVLLAGAVFSRRGDSPGTAVERGREVYLAEGCVACHSRYVREVDPAGWGPPSVPKEVLAESPVLIGNRRQGPDLTHVGARRSAAWLREHFLDPRKLVKDSTMPSYGYLFGDGRGDDLIAWLLAGQDEARRWRAEKAVTWQPAGEPEGDGALLFATHCAVCHGPEGRGDGELADRFAKRPANLVDGPFVWTADETTVARAIRWGLPGTDMPGHELISEGEVRALADRVMSLRNPPTE
ncbi:cbb3-type cytochrome c oxidase subunit II [Haloferula sargassicola]|uniref:Cytochrome c domain-containing protein n=1 Tax=Haloferula sargassicola TaxID=490096 RepID=A0ABP9UU53_9BACT